MITDRTRGRIHATDVSGRRGVSGRMGRRVPIRLEDASRGTTSGRPSGADSRGQRAMRRGRRRLSRALFGLVFLVCALGGVLGWATHSRLFALRTILVTGSTLDAPRAIVRTAGIRRGGNLLALSARTVRRRLLTLPSISDVQVIRRLPHTLVLRISESRPFAMLEVGSHRLLVNSDDRVIQEAASGPTALPRVTVGAAHGSEIPAVGQWVSDRGELAALRCIAVGQRKESTFSVSNVFIDSKRNLWLNISGFGKALLGPPTQLGPKLAALKLILNSTRDSGLRVRFLDLQEPRAPAYVPLPAPSTHANKIR